MTDVYAVEISVDLVETGEDAGFFRAEVTSPGGTGVRATARSSERAAAFALQEVSTRLLNNNPTYCPLIVHRPAAVTEALNIRVIRREAGK